MNTPMDMARQLVIDCPFTVDPQKGHSRIIEVAEHGPCLEVTLTFLIPALSLINALAEFQQHYEQRQTGHGSAASGAVLSQTSSHNGPDGDSGHAETVPAFDLPEAESELVSGYNVEYASMGFALFFLAEYSSMILMSSLTTIIFMGG